MTISIVVLPLLLAYVYYYMHVKVISYDFAPRISALVRFSSVSEAPYPESGSATILCRLLEIPRRGFLFQTKPFDEYRIPKRAQILVVKGFRFEKGIPSQESQVGDISQTSRPAPSLLRGVGGTCRGLGGWYNII